MFFPRAKIYTVHINPSKSHAVEKAIFVREGFNFLAFFFGVFWALYNRLWLVGLCLIVITALLGVADKYRWLDIPTIILLNLTLNIIVGYWANDWRRAALSRRGYIMSDVVVSDNELRAQQRYFDRVLAA